MSLPIIDDDKLRAHIMEEMEEEPIDTSEYKEPMQNFMSAMQEGNVDKAIELFVKLLKKIK